MTPAPFQVVRARYETAAAEPFPAVAEPGVGDRNPAAGGAFDEFWASLALKHSPGLGARTWKRLLERYGSASAAMEASRAWLGEGVAGKRQVEAFQAGAWREGAGREVEAARRGGANVLLWSDPAYPRRLKDIPDPPILLYWRGERHLLDGPCVALVGARQCSRYGLDVARLFGEELSRSGVTIVSGLAQGIDRQAHLAGLEGPGGSVAVLGAGVDVVYPAQNRDVHEAMAARGLLLSEFAPGTVPEARNFPARNRIISGLSLGVMVVEAAAKSGSLITARLAAEQGREVFAPPGLLTMPTFAGCHALIRQGATLVESAGDILAELEPLLRAEFLAARVPRKLAPAVTAPPSITSPKPPAREEAPARGSRQTPAPAKPARAPVDLPANLSEEEKRLLRMIEREARAHIDDLARESEIEVGRVSRTLLMLEIKGLVRKWPGMFYSIVETR